MTGDYLLLRINTGASAATLYRTLYRLFPELVKYALGNRFIVNHRIYCR